LIYYVSQPFKKSNVNVIIYAYSKINDKLAQAYLLLPLVNYLLPMTLAFVYQ